MIEMSVDGDIGTVVIDRPAKANSLTIEMWVALREVLLVLESRGDVGAVVIRGAGSRHFSAGADLDAVACAAADTAVATDLADAVVDTLATFASLSKPSLAVLNGTAAGGGAESRSRPISASPHRTRRGSSQCARSRSRSMP